MTGIGKSVNSLRYESGTVGDKVKALINRWKNMVNAEEEKERVEEEKRKKEV